MEILKKEKDAKHPVLSQLKCNSVEYVIRCVNSIQQQEIESALLLLPLQYLAEFMKICCQSVENRESIEKAWLLKIRAISFTRFLIQGVAITPHK